jgi:simple sugar transport system permease protein
MATDVEAPPRAADERVRATGLASRLLSRPELGALVGVVLVYVFFSIVAAENNFVSATTLASILNRAAPLGILSIAVALLMIAGEFDLSIGSLLGFSGMAIMILVSSPDAGGFGWPLWPAVGFALALAALTGAVNGLLVNVTKLP